MKLAIVLLATLAGAFAATFEDGSWRIVGGEEATDGQFPYQISLRNWGSHSCGGSILDETTILTAAHCVDGASASFLTVVVGSNHISQGGQAHDVSSIRVHAQYDPYRIVNDVAILKLSTPIKYTDSVKAIDVETDYIDGGADLVLSGWGRTSYPGSLPNRLQYAELKSISFKECVEKQTSLQVFESEICTFTRSGQGACHGDSGGPLVSQASGKQVGIVSWGTPCAIGYPDVFTRVSSFLDWIEDNRH